MEQGEAAVKDDNSVGALLCHFYIGCHKFTRVFHLVGLKLDFSSAPVAASVSFNSSSSAPGPPW